MVGRPLNHPRSVRCAHFGNNASLLRFACIAIVLSIWPRAAAQPGVGSAHINFETPPGYLTGFRDYLNNQGGTSGSPIIVVNDNGSQNRIPGVAVIATTAPDGSLVLTTLTDFDDLHTFSIAFDHSVTGQLPTAGAIDAINVVWYEADDSESAEAESLAGWQAAEALRIRDWQISGTDFGVDYSNETRRAAEQPAAPSMSTGAVRTRQNGIGFLYGLRIIDRQEYSWTGMDGGILGQTRTELFADNNILGPAAGLVWVKSRGPFTFRLQGLASIGYNSGNLEQSNVIGAELVPGAVNRLLYAQPTHSYHEDSHDEFSPNGELRADLNLRITHSITFAMNWSGVAIDNALETENRTRLYLPDFGLQDPGNQRLIVHNFFCGFEVIR